MNNKNEIVRVSNIPPSDLVATNTLVRRAIRKLIYEYSHGTHQCTMVKCSLCKIFYGGYDTSKNVYMCGNCPNTVFYPNGSAMGCLERGRLHRKLSPSYPEANREHLLKFWHLIHDCVPSGRNIGTKKFVIDNEFRNEMFRIAEYVQNHYNPER
jgi:hypothetical protein